MADTIFYTDNQFNSLTKWIARRYSAIVVLADNNTKKHCYPQVRPYLPKHHIISIPPGEEHKTLLTCNHIWKELTRLTADKTTLLINLGGGVIGDMGGFAAGCYKRGIAFINLPTTLLAMVDASLGGKTGVDFEGFKNQIGLFNQPEAVFIYTGFLKTLPKRELLSGFAEVIKHYLIADRNAFKRLEQTKQGPGPKTWNEMVKKNISIKQNFVKGDPYEKNIRKALNFGHTIGHAVESYFLKTGKKLLHGEAIAIGMITESFIAMKNKKLSLPDLARVSNVLLMYYKLPQIKAKATSGILEMIQQDKKSKKGKNQFTLLDGIGNFSINNTVEESVIMQAIQYYNSQLV